jgi:hypothetical protein
MLTLVRADVDGQLLVSLLTDMCCLLTRARGHGFVLDSWEWMIDGHWVLGGLGAFRATYFWWRGFWALPASYVNRNL